LRWGIWLIPVVCLLGALLDMPYGYYQLLRVLVFCASVYVALSEGKLETGVWFWAFAACALIYNPIFKLSLGREIWWFVNIATVVLYITHFWMRGRRADWNAGAGA
jgi:hypothetical protein